MENTSEKAEYFNDVVNSIREHHIKEQAKLSTEYYLLSKRIKSVDDRLNELSIIVNTLSAVDK